MKEISFNPKTPENAKSDVIDDQHVLLPNFQMGLEGDPFGAGKGVGVFFTARPNAIENKRFLGNDILDFDMKTDQVTRYKLNETKLDPSYAPLWKAKLTGNEDIKLT